MTRPGPYRSRRGMFLGVCRGLADYFDFSVTGVRLAFVFIALFTGVWPMVGGYLLAALLMRVEPVLPLDNDADAEFYNSYTASREMALLRVKRAHDQLERRIQRIESVVTARGYDWEKRLNGG
ncbi:MAG TPA: PspC domain-containing protein [Candidatus Hydrogenedentes bacterium]|nr:PspC domain-containing protein [Candidatus Hydrogenedentota bacterium]